MTWRILVWLTETAIGLGIGLAAADIVGMPVGVALGIDLVDDVVLIVLKRAGATYAEMFALDLFMDELIKMVHEATIYAAEDDESRDARHAALVRWHGQKVYLFGDVHAEDAALLWFAGRYLAESNLAASVFGVTADEMTVLL